MNNVSMSDEGVTLHTECHGDDVVALTAKRAQELAVEILARWPLERVDRETMPDWKADASRYLKDANMLTRRFARRTIALCDGFEEALVELAARAAVVDELAKQEGAIVDDDGGVAPEER